MTASNISGSGRGHRVASDDPSPSDHSGDEATVVCRLCLVRSRRISRRISPSAVLTIISASSLGEFSRRISGAGARAFLGGASRPLHGGALVRREVPRYSPRYFCRDHGEISLPHTGYSPRLRRDSIPTQDTQARPRTSRHEHKAQEAPRHAEGARSRRDCAQIATRSRQDRAEIALTRKCTCRHSRDHDCNQAHFDAMMSNLSPLISLSAFAEAAANVTVTDADPLAMAYKVNHGGLPLD